MKAGSCSIKDNVLPVIIGPTASGKSECALTLASLLTMHRKNSVIISADSRQVYKYLPVTTAHPPAEYQKKIKHYFINELEPNDEFNSGSFGVKGREIINNYFNSHVIPIVTGGSGLYINSLIYGFFDIDSLIINKYRSAAEQKKLRETLNEQLEKKGEEYLRNKLLKADKILANEIPKNKPRRIIRALEVYKMTGFPLSSLQNEKIKINFTPLVFGLLWDRALLYDRINKRTEMMLEMGLLKEIEKLRKKGLHYSKYNSLNTVGVKEAMDYLDGKISCERMKELIMQNTRRYAKRQMTWFRRDKNIEWTKIENEKDIKYVANYIFKKMEFRGI